MEIRNIIITAADHARLRSFATAAALFNCARGDLTALKIELERAEIVTPDEIPPDVITLNSRAELRDLKTGEQMEVTLVLPSEANLYAGKISVLAPLGTAMLGYRLGDEFEWTGPSGLRRLKVVSVHFQPEAALAAAA